MLLCRCQAPQAAQGRSTRESCHAHPQSPSPLQKVWHTACLSLDLCKPYSAVDMTCLKLHRPISSRPGGHLIPCASAGKALFAEAMLNGTMEGFFKLIEQYRTQDEPAFCGLARYGIPTCVLGLTTSKSASIPAISECFLAALILLQGLKIRQGCTSSHAGLIYTCILVAWRWC